MLADQTRELAYEILFSASRDVLLQFPNTEDCDSEAATSDKRMHELDAPMQTRLDAAHAQGRSLRYLAQLDANGSARVGLAMPEPGHASLSSRLTDNLIQFRTRRYAHNPLVVQGPGAGS